MSDIKNVEVYCCLIYGPERGTKKTFFIPLFPGKPKAMRRLARQKAREQIEKGQHPELGKFPDWVDIEVVL
jgi:hypothetical protein